MNPRRQDERDAPPIHLEPSTNPPANFRHIFAASRQVPLHCFERALFFDCAPLHALMVVLVVDSPQLTVFAPDYELIGRVAEARFIEEVETAISDFWGHPANDEWVRRKAKIRISTRRVQRLAAELLPSRASVNVRGM
jgi:hypothetical protein